MPTQQSVVGVVEQTRRLLEHSKPKNPFRARTRLASTEGMSEEGVDLTDKLVYQCALYQLSPGSTVDLPNAMTVEQRVRFQPNPEQPGYLLPYGPRTLILREPCDLEQGEIGREWFRLHIREEGSTHNGIGTSMDSTIATILYLASNPRLIQGNVLELSCDLGLAGLLGSIAAAFTGDPAAIATSSTPRSSNDDDVLTVPQHVATSPLPTSLQRLTLSDENDEQLNLVLANAKAADVSMSKVFLKHLDWSHATRDVTAAHRAYRRSGDEPEFYDAVLASDIDFAFPTSKELAKVVAHRLAPLPNWLKSTITPRFVHVCPDQPTREDIPYLHRYLERGYRMTVSTGYLKLQKLVFKYQIIPKDAPEDEALDEEPLELQQEQDLPYQSMTAQHHPDYTGVGEYFFPMETGEFDGSNTRTSSLEPETGGGLPW